MNKKKLIIIFAFVAVIIAFVIFNNKKTTSDSSNKNNTNQVVADQREGGAQYMEKDEIKQNVIYLTNEDMNFLVKRAHEYFDWTFSDNECRELCELIGNYIYTKAEWDRFMKLDSYVTDRVNSWIINDDKKWLYELLISTLKNNGITSLPKRTKK